MRLKHLEIITSSCALILALVACAVPPVTNTPVTDTLEAPGPAAGDTPTSPVATNSPPPPTSIAVQDLLREDNQGAVTVSVTPLNLDAQDETLKFDVVMSTHSVDLSMDLATLATLETDTGLSVEPVVWDAPSGGHHIGGTLAFLANVDGKPLLDGARTLTLTIRDVDVPARIFVWELMP